MGRTVKREGANEAPVTGRCRVPASIATRLKTAGGGAGEAFATRLDGILEEPLGSLTLTNNRSRILSVQAQPAPAQRRLFRFLGAQRSPAALRIHWSFALAPEGVVEAIAAFVEARDAAARRPALAIMRTYFAEFRGREPSDAAAPRPRRAVRLSPAGTHHDLQAIRDQLNEDYFAGRLVVDITWGRRPAASRKRRQRSIHLGTYDERRNLIRIHRRLDHPKVPSQVVASVVHHELLHAAMPTETLRGRRRLHPPEFRARERTFRGHGEAEAWIRDNLAWLLERQR